MSGEPVDWGVPWKLWARLESVSWRHRVDPSFPLPIVIDQKAIAYEIHPSLGRAAEGADYLVTTDTET